MALIINRRGMLAHSFDRFYVVTKFILPSIGNLDFARLNYDNTCTYLDDRNICDTDTKKYLLDLLAFCTKIELYVTYYKRQINLYNNTAHNILKNEIDLILPQISGKQKHGIITTIVFSFIGSAYEAFAVFYIAEETKLYIKQSRLCIAKPQSSVTN